MTLFPTTNKREKTKVLFDKSAAICFDKLGK